MKRVEWCTPSPSQESLCQYVCIGTGESKRALELGPREPSCGAIIARGTGAATAAAAHEGLPFPSSSTAPSLQCLTYPQTSPAPPPHPRHLMSTLCLDKYIIYIKPFLI